MDVLHLQHQYHPVKGEIAIAASKSESNRVLIINALSEELGAISNLANARDTETMQRLLKSNDDVYDVLDAGTTMRFLTAYVAVKNMHKQMTGSSRMKERPIGLLVDALRSLGANIEYLENDGYPPMQINGISAVDNNKLTIRGDVSSQYISALLMIAPILPNGLHLTLTGKVGSKPYIQMTINLMKHYGVKVDWNDAVIEVKPQQYKQANYTVEGDWSGASYWYSIAALAPDAEIKLIGLRKKSNQGDSVLTEMMQYLGVSTQFVENGVLLTKCDHKSTFEWDFTHCPDIAQTIAVICAAKGIHAKLSGLESLRIKETDRIAAIQTELAKFDITVKVFGDEAIEVIPGKLNFANTPVIATYKDHRMAMAFAPLALLGNLEIENPDVVNKSYPDFWRDLKKVGFNMSVNVSDHN